MFVGHNNICKIFAEYEPESHINSYDFCVTACESLKDAALPYSEHMLYIVDDSSVLKKIKPIANMNLCLFAPDPKELSSFLKKHSDTINYTIINHKFDNESKLILRNYFDEICGAGLVSETILNTIFYETGIQKLVDSFTRAFNNPVYVFDAGYNLVAWTKDPDAPFPVDQKIIANMGFSSEDFDFINSKNHIHKKVLKSELPVKVFNEKRNQEQLVCAIDTRKDMGHIVITSVTRPFNDMDVKLLTMLKEGIYQQLIRREFVRDNNGYPYEYFLKDILDGKIATSKQYLERMNYVNTTFSESLYCMVVETARSPQTLNLYMVRHKLESLFRDTKTLMYNGEIIVVFNLPKGKHFSKADILKIDKLCHELEIYAGISNNFNSLLDIQSYYKQALRAIEIGIGNNPEPGLSSYDTYYMQHLANIFSQKESALIYCHPALRQLLEYDKKHDTQLSLTLYQYLANERNSVVAAEAMFIHRNTLIYRLKKIDTLVDIDYDSFSERQYIILSYEILNPINDER